MSFVTSDGKKRKEQHVFTVKEHEADVQDFNSALTGMAKRLFKGKDDKDAANLFRGLTNIYLKKARSDNDYGLPRYDELTLMARRCGFYLYDCPDFTKTIGCDTAFVTNGDHVFMHADFFRELVKYDSENINANEENVIFVLLHELMHPMAGHHELLPVLTGMGINHPDANAGTDTWINLILSRFIKVNSQLKGKWNDEYKAIYGGAFGLTEQERNFFGDASDLAISRHYSDLRKLLKKEPPQNNQQQDGKPQDGKTQDGEPQDGKPQDGKPQDGKPQDGKPQDGKPQDGKPQDGKPQDGKPQDGKPEGGGSGQDNSKNDSLEKSKQKLKDFIDTVTENAAGDKHVVTTEELAKALEDSGHDKFKDVVAKLPDSQDKSAHKALAEQSKIDARTDHHAMAQAISDAKQKHGSNAAGGHIHTAMKEYIQRKHAVPETEASIEAQIVEHLLENGTDREFFDSEPDDQFFIDPELLGQEYRIIRGAEIYTRNEVPILAVWDSSGSMTDVFMSETAAALKGVLEGDNPVNKVYMTYADTVPRTELVEIDEDNCDEFLDYLEVTGRGGTDLQTGILGGLALLDQDDLSHRVAGIIVLTDTYDTPPNAEVMRQAIYDQFDMDELPPVVYIVPQGINVESFAMQVADHGKVVVYNERSLELDFEQESIKPMAM